MWQTALAVLVTYSLGVTVCLNSNGIRSSKETLESSEQQALPAGPRGNVSGTSPGPTQTLAQNPPQRTCSTPECSPPEREGCSNRSRRRGASTQDRQADKQANRQPDSDITGGNRTRGSCVRSGDCQPDFCCVRYLTAKRCQRIPLEGDACLLPGRSKRRRNLERCNCGQGLYCSPAGPTEAGAAKKQGVCLSRPGQGRRNIRHSGKKRRTAEDDC